MENQNKNIEKYKKELLKESETSGQALERLENIVRLLRKECPWDKIQTHKTLEKCLIEESYEVIDAIEKEDRQNLKEELGDVALQVVFHSVLEDEEGKFALKDVINDECDKMIRRHPHIFSDYDIKTVDKVLDKWENIKRQETQYKNYTDELINVPASLPALMRSQKVQKKAANVGFDWPDISGATEKLYEELDEVTEAIKEGQREHIVEEVGDLLFSVVNVARFLNIDSEEALRLSTEKFIQRFGRVEEKARKMGQDLKTMSLTKLDLLWGEVKRENNK